MLPHLACINMSHDTNVAVVIQLRFAYCALGSKAVCSDILEIKELRDEKRDRTIARSGHN